LRQRGLFVFEGAVITPEVFGRNIFYKKIVISIEQGPA
jgi:hypothetical protein